MMLLEQILAQWWHPVASSDALDLLHRVMHRVLYRHIVMAIKTAGKVGVFLYFCFVDCRPGSLWGNTEQVFARWRHPGASSVALDLLHWVMLLALLQCPSTAIKMACDRGGTFVCCSHLFCLL